MPKPVHDDIDIMDRLFYLLGIDIDNNYSFRQIRSFCNAIAEKNANKMIRFLEIHRSVVHTMLSEDSSKVISELKDDLAYSSNQWLTKQENLMLSKMKGKQQQKRAKKDINKSNIREFQKMMEFLDG